MLCNRRVVSNAMRSSLLEQQSAVVQQAAAFGTFRTPAPRLRTIDVPDRAIGKNRTNKKGTDHVLQLGHLRRVGVAITCSTQIYTERSESMTSSWGI